MNKQEAAKRRLVSLAKKRGMPVTEPYADPSGQRPDPRHSIFNPKAKLDPSQVRDRRKKKRR